MISEAAAAVDLYQKLKGEKTEFILQRFQEFDKVENGKVWKIRILHPNRFIDRLNVWIADTQLRLWDSDDAFVKTIVAGGGANFVVPNAIADDDAKVVIKSFKKKIRNVRFSDIEVTNP